MLEKVVVKAKKSKDKEDANGPDEAGGFQDDDNKGEEGDGDSKDGDGN